MEIARITFQELRHEDFIPTWEGNIARHGGICNAALKMDTMTIIVNTRLLQLKSAVFCYIWTGISLYRQYEQFTTGNCVLSCARNVPLDTRNLITLASFVGLKEG